MTIRFGYVPVLCCTGPKLFVGARGTPSPCWRCFSLLAGSPASWLLQGLCFSPLAIATTNWDIAFRFSREAFAVCEDFLCFEEFATEAERRPAAPTRPPRLRACRLVLAIGSGRMAIRFGCEALLLPQWRRPFFRCPILATRQWPETLNARRSGDPSAPAHRYDAAGFPARRH